MATPEPMNSPLITLRDSMKMGVGLRARELQPSSCFQPGAHLRMRVQCKPGPRDGLLFLFPTSAVRGRLLRTDERDYCYAMQVDAVERADLM